MEARYISGAANQLARTIAAGTVKARDYGIERSREPESAALAGDLEPCLVNPAQRLKSKFAADCEQSQRAWRDRKPSTGLLIARSQAHVDLQLAARVDSA